MTRAWYRRALRWGFLLAVVGLASGCSAGVATGGGGAAADVEELKRRVLELQKSAAVTEIELARLRQRLARLEAGLDPEARRGPDAAEEASPPPAAPPYREPAFEEGDLSSEAAPEPRRTSEAAEPGTPLPEEPVSRAAQALYDHGYTLYHQGRYLDAEAAFRRFLEAHGGTALADNAQYWIGECRYARKDYRGALAAFRETVERYPEGNKVPDALLKAGQCFEALEDLDGARASYREVVRRFPGTAAAITAGEREKQLP